MRGTPMARLDARSSLFGLAPCGVYPARRVTASGGALLPHLFTLTGLAVQATALRAIPAIDCPKANNGVAVCFLWHWPSTSLEARVPDVIRHTALRSSDFPPPESACAASGSDRPVLLPDVSVTEMRDGTKDLNLSDLPQMRLNLT